MASNITDFGETAFIGALLGQTSAVPTSFYMALLTAAPQVSDDGTTIQEPPATSGYGRQSFPNTSAFWSAASSGVVINTGVITFPLATLDWPVITHYAFCTAVTGGSMYLYGNLQLPRVIQASHLCKFDIGQLTVSLSGLRQSILSHS